ncbi:10010_t:CDS:2 [Funneliformis geosporum]|uniref:7609_t:CDS:1 n=1 Tax=Funneliformis geosporum TaxID=1117311 RepID=A0A9W4WYY7_9GLOM|nr:10010_t:CDS:2 [Funneliformis geosporum]CAI2195942.1 7609_t:CDS:2 [Funneliformis geosporum]
MANWLKEILNIAGRSGPKLDGKGFLKSLGTELLAQEDGVLNTHGKKTGNLRKLEYRTKPSRHRNSKDCRRVLKSNNGCENRFILESQDQKKH